MSQIVAKEGSAAMVSAGPASLCCRRRQAAAMMSKASASERASSWPFWRRHGLAAQPVEQGEAEPLLELAHLVAHRRLGDVQFLRGAREAAGPGGGFEAAQGIE